MIDIPTKGQERVAWWAAFFETIAVEAWRIGEQMVDEQGATPEQAQWFMEEYEEWVKEGVRLAVEQAVTCWRAVK